jgi:hypothetical protein
MERHGHQRFAGASGRIQDQVLAGKQLQNRLFLRGIQREPDRRHEEDEPVEDLVGAQWRLSRPRKQCRQWRRIAIH